MRPPQVRAAALACLADVVQWVGPELRAASLLPLIRGHMQVGAEGNVGSRRQLAKSAAQIGQEPNAEAFTIGQLLRPQLLGGEGVGRLGGSSTLLRASWVDTSSRISARG
jgi:hypothetical protein